MENKTILDILQKKKELGSFADGDKLYSPCLGNCILASTNDYCIGLAKDSSLYPSQKMQLRSDGRLFPEGEIMAFPSEKMRDWSRFAWEKYALLEKGRSKRVFFDNWASSDYTSFIGIDFMLEDDEVKVNRRTYNTMCYHSVAEDKCASFYETLFHYLGKKIVPFLAEGVPLYKEVTDNLILDAQNKERETEQDRKVLEKMTEKAILSDMAKGFSLLKGQIYYFENKWNKNVHYLAKFDSLSESGETARFHQTIEFNEDSTFILVSLRIKTHLCSSFRIATKEEQKMFQEKTTIGQEPSVDGKSGVGIVYLFEMADRKKRLGILKSVSSDLKELLFKDVVVFENKYRKSFLDSYSCAKADIQKIDYITDEQRKQYCNIRLSIFQPYSFKPKDWCLMRSCPGSLWILCQFAFVRGDDTERVYIPVGGTEIVYNQCIPYEGNEHLLGTSRLPDDGEL